MLDLLNLGGGPFTIMFDTKELKPGCALIQALGGSPGIANAFDPDVWLLAPTPGMRCYNVTKAELERLVELVHETHLVRRRHSQPESKNK